MTKLKRGGRGWSAAAGVALVATLATVAGSLAPTVSTAFASTTPTAAPTDAIPNWSNSLSEIKALAAEAISIRLNALGAAIKTVQGDSFLGADGTTLVNDMQSDITGLQALGTKINGDTTVAEAIADADLIFTEFRVYYVMLPVVHDVSTIDHAVNVDLPALSKDITTLQGEENSSNQPFIGPLISGMQSEVQIATGATTGLVAELLAYTPAEWDSNHRLFSTAQTAIQTADKAVDYANDYLARANKYLQSHPTTTTTTSTSTTTTSSTTSTTTPTTTTTVPGSNCAAVLSGTALGRTGWSASSNAPYSKADVPKHALDGNLSTRFSTNEHQAAGLYFQVNMRGPQSFDEVEMAVPNSVTDYARGYNVEVWNDHAWVTVASCTGVGTPEVVSFPTQTSQYVRVVLTAGTGFYWWSIDEFYVYTSSSIPTTTTTVAPTTTTTVAPTTTTTSPVNNNELRRLKAIAAQDEYARIRELAGAIKGVQDRPWLGSDGTTLVNNMQSDVSGLEALGNKIQGDATVPEVLADTALIFTEFRVFALVQPVVADVIRIDRITNITLPYLAKEITYLQSRENQHNQGVIGPLVASMQANDQTATNDTNGLSAELIGFTPAEWNANHTLLNGPTTNMLIAARAVKTSETDLAEALHYLNHHGRR